MPKPKRQNTRPARHLRGEERERQILEGATRFFAEQGFGGQTRELSASLGITQPLLYRYFPSKRHLIERIFEELFVKRWDPRWKDLISDRAIPLERRIALFYTQFDERILNREWVRLFLFYGLGRYPYHKRVFRKLKSDVFTPLCLELRRAHGLPDASPDEVTRQEIEMVWELHGVVFYHRMRKHVYGVQVNASIDDIVANLLFYLDGAAPRLFERLFPGRRAAPNVIQLTSRK